MSGFGPVVVNSRKWKLFLAVIPSDEEKNIKYILLSNDYDYEKLILKNLLK